MSKKLTVSFRGQRLQGQSNEELSTCSGHDVEEFAFTESQVVEFADLYLEKAVLTDPGYGNYLADIREFYPVWFYQCVRRFMSTCLNIRGAAVFENMAREIAKDLTTLCTPVQD